MNRRESWVHASFDRDFFIEGYNPKIFYAPFNDLREINHLSVQIDVAGFKFGNIEKVADQVNQAAAVGLQPEEPFFLFFGHGTEHTSYHDLNHSHYVDQRRAQVMGDHRREVRLHLTRFFEFYGLP